MPALAELTAFLDETLNIRELPDYPSALNGLQFANGGEVDHVATAVDFSLQTLSGAIGVGARLLLVHHGMFWGGLQRITGVRHHQIRSLVSHDVAVYAAHLPLDLHPRFGNNVSLAERLGLTPNSGFVRFETVDVGLSGESDLPTETLVSRARALAADHGGAAVVTPYAPGRRTRRWGICSGSGADSATLAEAQRRGLDTLIVGEGPHHTAVTARDLDIVIVYAGHYATETLGVQAVGKELARQFGVAASFIAAPTGL